MCDFAPKQILILVLAVIGGLVGFSLWSWQSLEMSYGKSVEIFFIYIALTDKESLSNAVSLDC